MSNSRVVTITGSLTPSAALPRGETRTVILTDRIQKLIDKGYVTVTEQPEVPVIAPVPATVLPPSKKATKAVWKAFLNAQQFEVPEDASRADMIDVWESWHG